MTAYILAGCALAILIGVFTKSWMSGRGGLNGVGPLGIEVCFGGTCTGVGWDNAPGDIQLIAYLALFAGIAAAAASAYMAFLVLSNTPNKFPAFKIINGVLGVGAFATTFFAVRLLIEGQEMSISWSPVFAIGGVVAAGIFVRKLRPYWPGQGTTPWPVAVKPLGQFGGAPMGGGYPPSGPPPGAPYPQQPYGAPMGQPYGAPPQPYGAPPGGAAPYGAPPMGAAPMGPPPMGGAAYGAPSAQPPFGAAPHAPPPVAPPSQPPYGLDGARPFVAAPNAPPPAAPMHGANPPPAGAPLPYAPTMAAPTAPQAPHNKATIMGAPAPQLAALLKQPPAAAATPPTAAAAGSQFCGRCGKAMTFVAQYQRWFCQGCQQYA